VTALDIAENFDRQRHVKARARRAGLCRAGQVDLVWADACSLPFAADTFDAFTAISSLEHVVGPTGDRQALSDAARVLKPGGHGLVTLPFRSAGSVVELTADLKLFQRHYSPQTLQRFLVEPSGLREVGRHHYGERLPFYALTRRLPAPLDWLRRPWDTLLTLLLLREVSDLTEADAILVELEKPLPAQACGVDPAAQRMTHTPP
jgi:SAM-dependent methyltransferase